MNRAFGGIEGGGIVAARIFCNEAFLRVIHPSIHPLIPTQFVPFYFYPLQVDALEERRRDVPLLVSRICEGKCSFSYSSESEERCGRCNNRSHAMQLCNCRVPANCPANQPTPTRSASETRGEGWSGDWNYGTMEGGGLAVGAGDDNIRLALVRPPPLLPPLSHTLIEKLREGVDSTATDE